MADFELSRLSKIGLLLLTLTYLAIFFYHTRRSVPIYRAQFRKRSLIPLIVHITAATFEITRYHVRSLWGDVAADGFDVVACFLHASTSLQLSKTLMRGDITTRPAYQAPSLVRPFVGLVAFVTQDPQLHRGSVKLVNAFIYTRFLIFLSKRFQLDKVQSSSTVYAQGVFLGAVVSIYESGLPIGVPLYILLVGLVMALERYTTLSFDRYPNKSKWKGMFLDTMLWLGLAELRTIQSQKKPPELVPSVTDSYILSNSEGKPHFLSGDGGSD